MPHVLNHESLSTLNLRVLSVERTKAGRWWNYRHVISPFSRLWLILGGRATVFHHGRRFTLKPGQLHLVPPFTVHDCACDGRLEHYYLHFIAGTSTGIDLFSLVETQPQLHAPNEALELFQRLEKLYPGRKLPCFDPEREEYKRLPILNAGPQHTDDAMNDFEARNALGLLLMPFLRSAHEQESAHARATRQFLAVQEFIQRHLSQPLSLADLARAANLHPTYFSDRFKRVVGMRPLDYLMRRRMEQAQFQLLTSQSSVKEIANAVGLPDPAYFSRVFSKFYRLAPSAYRAQHSAPQSPPG